MTWRREVAGAAAVDAKGIATFVNAASASGRTRARPERSVVEQGTCTISSSSARVRPAACSPTVSAKTRAFECFLLEAGGSDKHLLVRTPGIVGQLWRRRFDWTFFTEPQEHLGGRRMHWPRGKVLGGTSSINYMIYMRGHRDNYDGWRDAGNAGWGYADVLPLLQAVREQRARRRRVPRQRRPTRRDRRRGQRDERTAGAGSDPGALGVRENRDFNGAEQEGVGRHQATIRAGERCSAVGRIPLAGADRGRTSRSCADTLVTAARPRARPRGRRTLSSRWRRTTSRAPSAKCSSAAGAIGSPHLLLLSGIGPADELRAAAGLPSTPTCRASARTCRTTCSSRSLTETGHA